MSSIASDCTRRPQDPVRVNALVAELREHWGSKLDEPATDTAIARFAVACLVAGAKAGLASKSPVRERRRRVTAPADVDAARAEELILALARARLLYADLVGNDYDAGAKVLDSHGANKGLLRGAALKRHQELLARDRELLAEAEKPNSAPRAA